MPQKTFFLTRRYSWPFLLSVGIHGSLIAGLLYTSFNKAFDLPEESKAISVVMVNPASFEAAPAAKPAPAEPVPVVEPDPITEPKPEPEPEPVPEPIPEPVPAPIPEPKPKPKPVKKVEQPKPVKPEKSIEKRPPSPFTSEEPTQNVKDAPVRQAPAPASNTQSTGPRPLSRVEPQYPARAFSLRVEGRVKMQFDIDDAGRVDNVRVISAEPRNMFERDIRQAMRKWRYETNKPAQNLEMTFVFKINGGTTME